MIERVAGGRKSKDGVAIQKVGVGAIRNVFELAKRQYPKVESTNPIALWDIRYLRKVDDSGFIDKLYG